jgi:hypothetical protein
MTLSGADTGPGERMAVRRNLARGALFPGSPVIRCPRCGSSPVVSTPSPTPPRRRTRP